jgi:C-terminal four TMM region of protein-O-mannosyltransferase/Dolichyl-phosphate-mannose-protein mannosyltransferase
MQGAVGVILIALALGLAIRLILLYLLPGSGFGPDLASFRFWANDLATNGLYGFYERDFFHDYTPGYLYVLWLVGTVGKAIGGIGDLIKIPPVIADVGIAYLAWSMLRELGVRDRLAVLAALVVMLNPIFWFDNVIWGQVDSFGVLFLLLGLRSLWRDQPERAATFGVIAAVIKPQLGILLPIIAIVTIRRALRPVPKDPASVSSDDPIRRIEAQTGHPVRIVTTVVAGYLAALVLCLPFGLSVLQLTPTAPFIRSGLLEQIALAGGGYPYLTVNAYNAWAVVPSDLGISLAGSGQWVCDAATTPADLCGNGVVLLGAIPAILLGAVLLIAAILTVLWAIWRNPDRLTITVGLAVIALAFFMAPTRVHERYGFPFFAVGALLFAISPRWRIAYVVLSVATFANMYVVPTTIYPPGDPTTNPLRDWLGIGPQIRSQAGVTIVAVMHTVASIWAWLQLRRSARERLEEELYAGSLEAAGSERIPDAGERPAVVLGASTVAAAGSLAAPVTLPTWSEPARFEEVGVTGWLSDRLRAAPFRADRSRSLHGEGGGRFDRLDGWLLVVLILATLGIRLFRLAEPYQMHFDEVYHARTATEFLQDWRYGESHDIYEWTHPHLAKYAMAAGLVLWGGDHVRATSELGSPVRSVEIEPRREDGNVRAGERIHIATGEVIRTEDLRTRESVAETPAPGVGALAVDPTQTRIVLGADDGTISTIDMTAIGVEGADSTPVQLATVPHPIVHLMVTDDGTIVAASDLDVTTIDGSTGEILGRAELDDVADLGPGGSGPVLQADPAAIDDPSAVAETIAALVGGDPQDYESRITRAAPGASVLFGSPGSGDTRTAVDDAIADGRLPGVQIVDLPRVAVATAEGVSFIDPATATTTSTVPLDGGAHGLALAVGLDDHQLYVTSGSGEDPTYHVIQVGGDEAANGPVDRGSHPLPGLGADVAFDEATQHVHILGSAPSTVTTGAGSGDRWTVYVIEPHANAVYADALLPPDFTPVDWAMDVEPQYQTDDPEELLVFDGDGTVAAIDTGSHAFAWRLPGVLAGVLTAACLYVLARILFARRSVAVAVGAFALLDGMFFVQSRIGMNDVYVGLFIVAAYTVFAATWTGWWRGRFAFWIAMPIIGVLLGLALASKWVAAYAIGALVLLLLVRSALGRVVAILGLIAITGALGYLAMAGQSFGNLPFLVIMIALTLLAVVVAVFHPIAWTDEEMWLALLAPAAVGAALFFGALALGELDTSIVIGPVSVTPLLAAIAASLGSVVVYVAFRVGGSLGYGPLAQPLRPGDPARALEPPGPAPTGWLRPGWAYGIPIVWVAICLVAVPLGVYVVSYLPWAAIENHRLWPGYPADHGGQTLSELTRQMYDYHNGLTSPHPASSPWWAFPFDLKPVWFYQEGFAGSTTGAIYDSGSLVIWWLGIAALIFVSIMAYRRRSPALALIAIGFAGQWVPWARIDRAAFQYHYYTALPFLMLALAYLVAELWHGPSRRTWMWIRIAAAAAIIGPALMWLFSRPLCALVGVTIVNPGSQACPAVIPDFVLTIRTLALLALLVGGWILFWIWLTRVGRQADRDDGPETRRTSLLLLGAAVAVAVGIGVASLLPETPLLTWRGIPVEPVALLVLMPLLYLAGQVVAARDARRFVVGIGAAVVAWFVLWYPNLSALPLPSTVANAFQGLLPTYLYAFQFPVNTAARQATPLLSPIPIALTLALAVTCLVVAYSASVWRLALAESRANAGSGSGRSGPGTAAGSAATDGVDGLARTGGGA